MLPVGHPDLDMSSAQVQMQVQVARKQFHTQKVPSLQHKGVQIAAYPPPLLYRILDDNDCSPPSKDNLPVFGLTGWSPWQRRPTCPLE